MKKLSMILLLVLLVGVAMAKPPTKQERKQQKQEQTKQYAEEVRKMLMDGQFRFVDLKGMSAYVGTEFQVSNQGQTVAFYVGNALDYLCNDAGYEIMLNTENRIVVRLLFNCKQFKYRGYISTLEDSFTIDCNLKKPNKNGFKISPL